MKRILALFTILMVLAATPLFAASVKTMDKDQLKGLLGSEDLVLLDVRTGRDWSTSEFKIKGAERVHSRDLSAVEQYPRDHTFVFYCA